MKTDTKKKRPCEGGQRLDQWGHKLRKLGATRSWKSQEKVLPWSLWKERGLVDTLIDFGLLATGSVRRSISTLAVQFVAVCSSGSRKTVHLLRAPCPLWGIQQSLKRLWSSYCVSDELPWWLSNKESACQCRRLRFDSWAGKIPWRRAGQPSPVFLPGESPWTEEPGGLQPMGSQSWTGLRD